MSEIEKSRKAYLPEVIRWILIAESPPSDPERFFYYPNVKKHDHLFLAVMKVLYPAMYNSYISTSRVTHVKVDLLRRFQSDGFYLLDLFEKSSDINQAHESQAIGDMIKLLRIIATQNTPIILIKSTVYDLLNFLNDAGFFQERNKLYKSSKVGYVRAATQIFPDFPKEIDGLNFFGFQSPYRIFNAFQSILLRICVC